MKQVKILKKNQSIRKYQSDPTFRRIVVNVEREGAGQELASFFRRLNENVEELQKLGKEFECQMWLLKRFLEKGEWEPRPRRRRK